MGQLSDCFDNKAKAWTIARNSPRLLVACGNGPCSKASERSRSQTPRYSITLVSAFQAASTHRLSAIGSPKAASSSGDKRLMKLLLPQYPPAPSAYARSAASRVGKALNLALEKPLIADSHSAQVAYTPGH